MRELLEERAAALREQIDAATARLAQLAESIAESGMTVPGSKGQDRPNPLLAEERELRVERAKALREMTDVVRRLETVEALERANEVTAWGRSASGAK